MGLQFVRTVTGAEYMYEGVPFYYVLIHWFDKVISMLMKSLNKLEFSKPGFYKQTWQVVIMSSSLLDPQLLQNTVTVH